jgi:hypothetical protein
MPQTITIDAELLDGAIQAPQVSTAESPSNPAGAGYALGILTAVRAASAAQPAAKPAANPYHAELSALKAAVRGAGFDIALLCGGGVALRRRPDLNTALST